MKSLPTPDAPNVLVQARGLLKTSQTSFAVKIKTVIIVITYISCLLCGRHYAKKFTYITSFIPNQKTHEASTIIISIFQ